jgi:methionyl-tRNA formyltransferase
VGEDEAGARETVRIVFWGTPEFALPSLRALLGEAHDVVAVVTQPDRPAGRHRQLRPPPVKVAAIEERIPVAQPEKPRGEDFVAWLADQQADLNVVVAYGQILRSEVLHTPRLGSVNLHASLLPALRGAAPIQWAIARGHEITGVSVIRMNERMDAGPILLQVPEPIGPDETAADLTSRLSEIGAEALVETLALMEVDDVVATEQDESRVTLAPLITRAHAHINWLRTAAEVSCQIRAFDDAPGAWTQYGREEIKLFRPATGPDQTHTALPGTVLDTEPADPARGLLVACGSGAVWVREVQPAGRRRMMASEWLRGRSITTGECFI